MRERDWHDTFHDLHREWLGLGPASQDPPGVSSWQTAYDQMLARSLALKRKGQWISGHADLLHVAEVAGAELLHSAVVAWLLTPTGRHGLGGSLLYAILRAGWGAPVPETDKAVVVREVVHGPRRADIVVYVGMTTIVIENKIWSGESDRQCEDLFDLWSGGTDVRFLLLTLDGHPPRQTRTPEAAEAWRRLSYGALVAWLEEALIGKPASVATGSIRQYVAALRKLAPSAANFEVQVGGGNVDG